MSSSKAFSELLPFCVRELQAPPQSGSFPVAAAYQPGQSLGREMAERAQSLQRARQWQRTSGVEALRVDALENMLHMERSNRG